MAKDWESKFPYLKPKEWQETSPTKTTTALLGLLEIQNGGGNRTQAANITGRTAYHAGGR